jgi:hypothetical protein
MPAEDNQGITWERVAQIALWILGIMVVGACSLTLTILINQSDRIDALESSGPISVKTVQDEENMNLWRIQQLESTVATLKDESVKIQRQLDIDQDWIDAQIDVDKAQQALKGKR